ncbi:hypothetical protein MJO29_014999 [Puccinia striiformis f. sp. tritici]|nr:hypothetical protein MJO29_014999 [Puccinia striiformis f. sp. tritici]
MIGVLAIQGAFKEHLVHLRRIQATQPLTAIAGRPGATSCLISYLLSRSCTTHQQSLGPDSHVVAVKFQHLFATSFWPELSPDHL